MKQLVIEDLNSLGELLEKERKAAKLNRAKMAEFAFCSSNTIYYVERKGVLPTPTTLKFWAAALGYDEIIIKC